MANGYCMGCTCDPKSISGPNFNSCRTRLVGGVCGILITCHGEYGLPDPTLTFFDGVDFTASTISTDLHTYLSSGTIDNNTPLTESSSDTPTSPHFHYWCIDADMPETEDEVEEPNNYYKKSIVGRTQKLAGDILDVNTDNYNMMKEYQCLGDARIWFVTTSGQFYGGEKGIEVVITKFNYLIPRGIKEAQKISFEFEWECQTQPPRIDVDWCLPEPGFI